MNIRIYQVNMKRDTNNVAFMRYELLEKLQGSQSVDSKIYDKVFDGEVDCQTLEDVYQMFNLNHPEGYKDRSLSVSDVVEVMEDPMHPHCFYFCDSIGFKPIDFEPKDCQLGRTFTDTEKKNMISVLLVEPNKYPKMIEIEDSLEAMQKIVGGDIEEYMPFEDEVAIICNDESKMNGMLPNRAVYAEPETVEMSYQEMTKRFREAENNRKEHLTGYVVFTEDSFDKPYSEESRTYVISSNNKAFQSGMGGYSIYASCLDGTDPCLRLDGYMSAEHGGENGWKIEKCYMKENSREMLALFNIVQGTITRNKGILETDVMKKKCAVIIGCGSVGSLVAMELARAGVEKYVLCDADTLEYHNVCRHQCGIEDVGDLKVNALKRKILNINPKVYML